MNARWIARGLVAALHLALLAGLWLHRPAPLPATGDLQLTTVRLIAPTPARRPPARQRLPAWAPPPVGDWFPAPPPPTITLAPQIPAADTTAATPPAAAAPRSTLRLTLPPGYAASSAAARNPALEDPRSHTPRLTLEDRIADATGGAGSWVEERTSENRAQTVGAQGDHRSVFRRGNTCVEVFRSRIADMDPFNGNVAPRGVSMVGKPYQCK